MRWGGARLALGALVLAMSLAWAAPALADTFCVNAPGCTGKSETGVQEALNAANNTNGPDTIHVGPGTYHGPFQDSSSNQVALIGAGDGTVFDDPSGSSSSSIGTTLTISDASSSFSDFKVVVPPGVSGIGISSGGTVDHVLVTDASSDTSDVGVEVVAGSLSHSRIILRGAPNGTAAPEGIAAVGFIQDTLVHMLTPGARGIEVEGLLSNNVQARQLTLVGPGDTATGPTPDTASRGVSVDPSGAGFFGSSATITLDGTIIQGFAHALAADGSQSPGFCITPPCTQMYDNVATINVSYSDFDPANDIKGTQDSTITQGSGDLNVDPGFKSPAAGDYSLQKGSALIDAGDPAVPRPASGGQPADSTTDLAGNPRVSDGNGDGHAVVDIGAYEFTNHPPVAVIKAPAHALTGQAVHLSGSSSHDPDGNPITFLWSFGDGNQSTAANPTHTYFRAGTYTVTLVVTDSLGAHSKPATMKIKVTPPCVVPKVRGDKLSAAKTALQKAHCSVGKVTRAHSHTVASGRVISSDPVAGTHLATGAPVALTVSRGR